MPRNWPQAGVHHIVDPVDTTLAVNIFVGTPAPQPQYMAVGVVEWAAGQVVDTQDAADGLIGGTQSPDFGLQLGFLSSGGTFVAVSPTNPLPCTGGGGGGGDVQYVEGATTSPATGTVALGRLSSTSALQALSLDPSGNLNVNVQAGGGSSNVNVAEFGGTAVTIGQQLSAASIPVVLASDQSAIAVTGTFWQATQPVSIAATVNTQDAADGTIGAAVGTVATMVGAESSTGNVAFLNLDASGNLKVVASGTTSTQYTDETAETAGAFVGTVAMGYNGTDVVGLRLNSSNQLEVAVQNTVTVSGTVAATQSGTWTVGISAGQTIAVTNAGTFAVQDSTAEGYLATLAGTVSGGAVTVAGTVAVTQSTSPWVVSLASTTITGSVAVTGTFWPYTLGQQTAANSVPVILPSATITTLTPPTAAAIAAAIVSNPPTTFNGVVTNAGTFAVQDATAEGYLATLAGTVTSGKIAVNCTQVTSPWVVDGNLTHNNAAPTSNNVGALVAVASSSAPTYNAGDQVLLSTDLSGNLRTTSSGGGGGGTQYTDGTAESAGAFTGTVAMLYNGTDVVGLRGDSSNNLYVNVANSSIAVTNAGTFAVQASQGLTAGLTSGWLFATDATGNGTVTASWTSSTTDNTTLNYTNGQRYPAVTVKINATTTITGGTLIFEYSTDNVTTWIPIQGVQVGTTTIATSYNPVASTSTAFQFYMGAAAYFRVRLHPQITGTGTVTLDIQGQGIPACPFVTVQGTVAISGTPAFSGNITEWNSVALGSPATVGGILSGTVIGTNSAMYANASGTLEVLSTAGFGTPVSGSPYSLWTNSALYVGGVTINAASAWGTYPGMSVVSLGVNAEMFVGNTVLAAVSNYGTAPSAVAAMGVNAYVTNSVAVTNAGTFAVQASCTQNTSPWIVAGGGTAGTPGSAVLTVQGISGGTAIPVSGTFYQATQPVSIASTVTTTPVPTAGNGWSTNVQQALSTTLESVKASAGSLGGYAIFNPNAVAVYFYWYNNSTSTVGSTTGLIYQIGIPAGGAANIEFDMGVAFSSKIDVACSTSATSSAAPSTGCVVTTLYA